MLIVSVTFNQLYFKLMKVMSHTTLVITHSVTMQANMVKLPLSQCDGSVHLLSCKRNVHIEYSCIRKALLPYANDIIRAQNQNSNTTYEPKVLKAKSKPYYKDFICNKAFSLTVVSSHLHPYCIRNQIDERTVFTRHICCEKEKKLKEFNFKNVTWNFIL